jgi:hypothetical protein
MAASRCERVSVRFEPIRLAVGLRSLFRLKCDPYGSTCSAASVMSLILISAWRLSMAQA